MAARVSSCCSPSSSVVSPLRRSLEEAAAVAKTRGIHCGGPVPPRSHARPPTFLPHAQRGPELPANQRRLPLAEAHWWTQRMSDFLRGEAPHFSSTKATSSTRHVNARSPRLSAAEGACKQSPAAVLVSRHVSTPIELPFVHSNRRFLSPSPSASSSFPYSSSSPGSAAASTSVSRSASLVTASLRPSVFSSASLSFLHPSISPFAKSRACLPLSARHTSLGANLAHKAALVPQGGCLDSQSVGRRSYSGEPRIRNKNSRHTSEWIKRQITDRYVLRAQERNLRSRAAFKLEQLDDEFLFFRKNQVVVDLGAYPGGWSQVALDRIRAGGGEGRVVAVDPVAMDPLPHHTFIQGSVGQAGTLQALLEGLGESKADVVLSDMAPACIGVKQDDHLNCAELCLHASDLMEQTNNFKIYLRTRFKRVSSAKPRACRPESREMYFVCQHFLGRERLAEEVQLKGCFTGKEGYL
ncbi:putative ribosomal RNA large subunit methyltransferase J [Neospora caninum Liverpool]|uniref:rRNA methyltransferase 2, mitochondrial n=1 Tax=Neospora caninum (strain Liverpool) TaxID=572307 RepID=F0V8F4_NEOCL|nr:putative ribosomal RNA large subunit methyltransferase J [Neospora caninum Liverpool]CBZ49995.1 putative ribosomal RNA large subunit methyltransferase J [Neospora caninum Liverpool]|eukprot:XP_003880030.1 putative ribosomal RNA large subunit methyltransferase J [Neospora caninum Liverpool]